MKESKDYIAKLEIKLKENNPERFSIVKSGKGCLVLVFMIVTWILAYAKQCIRRRSQGNKEDPSLILLLVHNKNAFKLYALAAIANLIVGTYLICKTWYYFEMNIVLLGFALTGLWLCVATFALIVLDRTATKYIMLAPGILLLWPVAQSVSTLLIWHFNGFAP